MATKGVKLPEGKDPFAARSPFDVLGVPPSATGRDLNDAHSEKLDELNYEDYPDEERIAKREEITRAYDAIRDARGRAGVKLFVFDPTAGQQQTRAEAERNKAVEFDFGRILKGSDAVFPVSPDVPDPRPLYRPAPLDRSARLRVAGDRAAPDPVAEAIDAIRFDQ